MSRVSQADAELFGGQLKVLSRGDASLTQDQQIERYLRTVHDPLEFFKYVRTLDSATNQVSNHPLYDHTKVLILEVTQKIHKRLALFKSKQIMCSWTMGGVHLYMAHQLAAKVLCTSKGEDYAADLVDKSRFINNQMPDWLKLRSPQENTTGLEMNFPDTMARIRAYPSTKDACVGETASHVTRDELEFHEYGEENFAHVAPTIDKGLCTLCDMSTSNRANPQSHMKKEYRGAKRGENGFYPMFFPWYVDPTRTWKWYWDTMKTYPVQWMFLQNYPTIEDDFLGAVEGLGLFDKVAIDRLLNNARPPLREEGPCWIYSEPDPKKFYYAGGDAAEGRGGDYSVLWIGQSIGEKRGVAAVMRSNQIDPKSFAFYAVPILRRYGSPRLVCGSDAWGLMFLGALKDLHYDNIENSKDDKLGYNETEMNKQENLMNLALAVKDGMEVPYAPAIDEMYGWVIDKGKYVSTGAYDDCIIAASKAEWGFQNCRPISDTVEVQRWN